MSTQIFFFRPRLLCSVNFYKSVDDSIPHSWGVVADGLGYFGVVFGAIHLTNMKTTNTFVLKVTICQRNKSVPCAVIFYTLTIGRAVVSDVYNFSLILSVTFVEGGW